MIRRIVDPPFNCTTGCAASRYQIVSRTLNDTVSFRLKPAVYAGQLHDAVYLYALALNRTLKDTPEKYRDGKTIMYNAFGTFNGYFFSNCNFYKFMLRLVWTSDNECKRYSISHFLPLFIRQKWRNDHSRKCIRRWNLCSECKSSEFFKNR